MKTINNEYIRKLRPCYNPNKYVSDDSSYTILDVIDNKDLLFDHKLWIILRTDFVSERIMRLFAVWCYRQTLEFIKNPDIRSVEAANTAEKYANGEATQEELDAARTVAEAATEGSAAMSATWYAQSAAMSAIWSARSAEFAARSTQSAPWYAQSAAQSATMSAAASAAESAAQSAIISAAASDAESAAQSAAWYAQSAAWSDSSASRSAQAHKLREMIINGIKTGDTY